MAADKAAAQAKKKVSRTAVKKVKDKWKAKQWYTIRAPRMFNGVAMAETLADETDKLMGRVAEATLQDLTGDFSKMHIKVYFKVNGVKGNEAVTKYVGHELTSDYIRRLTRRKHSKVDVVIDVTTADGWNVRVKPMAITEKRTTSSQETEIRRIAEKVIQEAASTKNIGDFVRELTVGEISQNIFKQGRLVCPLKRVEIRKSHVMREPAIVEPDMDVFAMPATPEVAETPTNGGGEAEAEAPVAAEETEASDEAGETPAEEEQVEEEEASQ